MAAQQLRRSETDRMIGGVAGGLAAYFGVDPTLVRLAWVLAGLLGFGVFAYILLWIVVPKGPTASSALRIAEERFARGEITREELDTIRRDLEESP